VPRQHDAARPAQVGTGGDGVADPLDSQVRGAGQRGHHGVGDLPLVAGHGLDVHQRPGQRNRIGEDGGFEVRHPAEISRV
jgi:hypothetical protein